MTKTVPPPPPPQQPGIIESLLKWGANPHQTPTSDAPTQPSLWELMARPEVKGLYYRNQQLLIDGYRFIGCRFDNCILETKNGNFDIISCVIDNSNRFQYGPEARKVIQLFTSRYDWAASVLPQAFVARTEPDGTTTITAGS